jgi:asparagine synthase (glutamine-hydrolysing)
MFSKSERYVIVFNGEIYNHLEIRNEINLKNSIKWKGNSDTETLVSAIEIYGTKLALKKCTGMFSFALWDKFENKLVIARDRMGEKPMYYGIQKNTFLFGSELKSLVTHPEFLQNQNYDSLSTYLRLGYIPKPYTIWDGIKKLEPGQLITISITSNNSFNLETDSYWSLSDVIISSQKNQFSGSEDQAIKKLESLIIKSLKGQMLSDVPLGAFLSGGIDSSLIVSVMQSISNNPVKTFSIGFENKKYNEAHFAKSIANHLKTDHTEFYVNEKDTLDVIPSLAQMFDEPFGDSSAIPTYLVSKLAKKHVTVSLSGDGGDELFGGYSRYHNSKV